MICWLIYLIPFVIYSKKVGLVDSIVTDKNAHWEKTAEDVRPPEAPLLTRNEHSTELDDQNSIVREGFDIPAEDDYDDDYDADIEGVDLAAVVDIDENIEKLSAKIESSTRPQDRSKILSLEDTLKSVLTSSKVANLHTQLGEADARAAMSRVSLFPDLSATYKSTRSTSDDTTKDSPQRQFPARRQHDDTMGINASYTLFKGFSTFHDFKSSHARLDASRFEAKEGLSSVFLEAINAYSAAIEAQNLLLVRRRSCMLANEALKVAQDRLKHGDITRAEMKGARAGLSQARTELDKAEIATAKTRSNLEKIMNEEIDGKHLLPLTLPPYFPVSLEEAKERALQNNYSIKRADKETRALKYQALSARGGYSPTVSVSAGVDYGLRRSFYTEKDRPDHPQKRTDMYAQLQVSIPIDYKGQTRHNVRISDYRLEQERAKKRYTRLDVLIQVKQAWDEFKGLERSVRHLQSRVKATASSWKSFREGFAQGSRIAVELLQSEKDYVSAEVDLIKAKQDYIVQGFKLLLLVGELKAENIASKACPFTDRPLDCAQIEKLGGISL
ncbi:MAG: TolC family protein [Alphaproteobacteria bacterium]|nr:TolC family protein [Alphaproteobacteria bacterium]